nr:Fe2+-dependent dioxygenase [Rheinheimera maricola]
MHVIIINQLLSADEVSMFRQQLQHARWLDGKNTAMGMAAAVKRNGQADATDSSVQKLANQLLSKFGHNAELISAALPQRIFPPCFNRYSESETYGLHVDGAIMRLPGNEVMRSDLSITTFLSEPEEYSGGELIIHTPFGQQSVKLAAGDAVLYNSGSLHRVSPVTAGTRLAAISWIQSMVADVQMRETLYQLDQSIQSLMHNDAVARDELDRLHHVYHNLIRQHAEV